MQQERGRFGDAHRRGSGAVEQGGDLGIGIDGDEARPELLAVADLDQPGVVFGALVARRQQLLEHDGDLLPVGRTQRIELERMLAHRQLLLRRRPGDRPVDVGEAMLGVPVPGPDLGRGVFGGHA